MAAMKRILAMGRRESKCATPILAMQLRRICVRRCRTDKLIGGERESVIPNGDSPEASVARGVVSFRRFWANIELQPVDVP